jgi:hypothetical protein
VRPAPLGPERRPPVASRAGATDRNKQGTQTDSANTNFHRDLLFLYGAERAPGAREGTLMRFQAVTLAVTGSAVRADSASRAGAAFFLRRRKLLHSAFIATSRTS